jgi:hypothetical protein
LRTAWAESVDQAGDSENMCLWFAKDDEPDPRFARLARSSALLLYAERWVEHQPRFEFSIRVRG